MHEQCVMFRLPSHTCMHTWQQSGGLNVNQDRNPLKIGTAEKKLLVIVVYYVILAVVALTTFTIFSRTLALFLQRLFKYFMCEEDGSSPPDDLCDQTGFQGLTNPIPSNMSFVLLAVNPWLNLVFAINVKELKERFSPYVVQRTKSLFLNSSTSNHNSNTT